MCSQYNPVEMYIVYMCTKTGNEDMNFCLYKCANRCYTKQQPSHCGSAGTLDLSSRHDVLFFIPELTPLTILSCCRDFQVSQETRHHSTCISIPARPAQMFCLGRNSSSRLLSATQFHSFGPSHSGKHEKSSKCRTARRTHRTSAHTHDHFVSCPSTCRPYWFGWVLVFLGYQRRIPKNWCPVSSFSPMKTAGWKNRPNKITPFKNGQKKTSGQIRPPHSLPRTHASVAEMEWPRGLPSSGTCLIALPTTEPEDTPHAAVDNSTWSSHRTGMSWYPPPPKKKQTNKQTNKQTKKQKNHPAHLSDYVSSLLIFSPC